MGSQIRTQALWGVFIFIVWFTFTLWSEVLEGFRDQGLRLVFFDVGQGDAIFIETAQGHQILIDGGPDETILHKLDQELPFWDRTIDLVILTHPDKDHLGGLLSVLEKYHVEHILQTGVLKNTGQYQKWRELLLEEVREGAEVFIADAPQRFVWTREETMQFLEILYPLESVEGKEFKNTNDTSVVAKLVFFDHAALLPGDIAKKVERKLLEEGVNVDADILKIAHHGSRSSTSEEFLKAVTPSVAVIQNGKNNRYGHPHPEVLAILHQYGIEIRRTDLEGDILFNF